MNNATICSAIFLCLSLLSCNGQNKPLSKGKVIGGGCDGCELMYVGMPDTILSTDTSQGWYEHGQKLLVTGTIFQLDGKTPAPDVVLYYWQTDNNGHYSPSASMDKAAARHGHIRGWVKTGTDGKYTINTIRPAPYPGDVIPAHIHLSVKEPELANEYYVDEINFDDDKLLLPYLKKHRPESHGGSGIVRVLVKDSMQIAEHDIILGLNIPDYPGNPKPGKQSGLNIGEDQPSFMPFHAFGPDKGSRACPVCKYGRYHGIIYFVGNNPDWADIGQWLKFLESESQQRRKYLKVYFVYGNAKNYDAPVRQAELEKLGSDLKISTIALTFVPSFADRESEVDLNKINPYAENTFVIYKNSRIVDKFIDLKPSSENFRIIMDALDRTIGEYFDLAEREQE